MAVSKARNYLNLRYTNPGTSNPAAPLVSATMRLKVAGAICVKGAKDEQ